MHNVNRIHLICGGRFHDFDLARLTLLKIMAEQESVRCTCANHFRDVDRLDGVNGIILYNCDLLPDESQTTALDAFVNRGGRIFALHATNAPIEFTDGPSIVASGVHIPGLVKVPTAEISPRYMSLLGSRFVAHLASQAFTVNVVDADHELTRGLNDFAVTDEPYVSEMLSDVRVLLSARYKGDAPGYVKAKFADDPPRPQLYVKDHGRGSVAYLTLGHSCGRFDLRPMVEEVAPVRGPWDDPNYQELLRRGICWIGKAAESAGQST